MRSSSSSVTHLCVFFIVKTVLVKEQLLLSLRVKFIYVGLILLNETGLGVIQNLLFS